MEITDEKLFQLCRHYGEISLKYRRKFAGLLPEVYKRRLFEKKGFSSIFEFAAKLAGMSEEQVRLVLNLGKRFEDKPILKALLVNGEVSVNKLSRIASIARPENQEFLAEQAKLLPQAALETLVRDEKSLRAHSNPSQNSQQASGASQDELFLNPEVKEKLFKLQQKGIDINQLILEFLQKREMEIAQKKEKLASAAKPTNSRYIKKATRELLKQEFGVKCSIEWCHKEADEIHHTQRFAMTKNHNPRPSLSEAKQLMSLKGESIFLAPLCEEHHAIAHSIDLKIQEKRRR